MSLYKYQVTDNSGRLQEIIVEGESEEDSVKHLRNRCLYPVKFYGEISETGKISFHKHFNVYMFTNRLVPLLQAHVPLERALGIIADGTAKEKEKDIIVSLRKGLHEGKSFSELIRNHGNRFPKIYANLVEAGEETGAMEVVMKNLQHFLNESKEQRDFLITSSIYPAVILAVTILAMILMLTVFIPRFSQIFIDMGKELPLSTEIMLTLTRIINTFWPLWLLLLLGGTWFFLRIRRDGPERNWWDSRILKLPILGRIITTVEISHFIRTLSILLDSHVYLLKSIQIAIHVVVNKEILKSFGNLVADLRGGSKLSKALGHSKYIPLDVIQMIQVGEESGELSSMLGAVADELEKGVEVEIKRLLALFEPAVIVLLALVILLVVISIFMAVIEMNHI